MRFSFTECGSRKVSIRVTLPAGSEVEGKYHYTAGMAHLAEHMVAIGSRNATAEETAKARARIGADWNAATCHDRVMYYLSAPADQAVLAAKILADMVLDRKFTDAKDLEREKAVVLSEKQESLENLEDISNEALDSFLCDGPIGRAHV